jgi:hypothetical protein
MRLDGPLFFTIQILIGFTFGDKPIVAGDKMGSYYDTSNHFDDFPREHDVICSYQFFHCIKNYS